MVLWYRLVFVRTTYSCINWPKSWNQDYWHFLQKNVLNSWYKLRVNKKFIAYLKYIDYLKSLTQQTGFKRLLSTLCKQNISIRTWFLLFQLYILFTEGATAIDFAVCNKKGKIFHEFYALSLCKYWVNITGSILTLFYLAYPNWLGVWNFKEGNMIQILLDFFLQ